MTTDLLRLVLRNLEREYSQDPCPKIAASMVLLADAIFLLCLKVDHVSIGAAAAAGPTQSHLHAV